MILSRALIHINFVARHSITVPKGFSASLEHKPWF